MDKESKSRGRLWLWLAFVVVVVVAAATWMFARSSANVETLSAGQESPREPSETSLEEQVITTGTRRTVTTYTGPAKTVPATVRAPDGPCDSSPPYTPERTCEGADEFYTQAEAELAAREKEEMFQPCLVSGQTTTAVPDLDQTVTQPDSDPVTTLPVLTSEVPGVTVGPPCLPCSEVTGSSGEIYQRCLNDDGTTSFPESDPVTGDIPCDTQPPKTLGPGCIGYQP